MKKKIMSLIIIACFIVSFVTAVPAESLNVVYESGAGIRIPFPAEWTTFQKENTNYYYPPNVYNSNGNAMGAFLVYRPDIPGPITEDMKDLFLFNYKLGTADKRKYTSITKAYAAGLQMERAGFTQEIGGTACNCEDLYIINDGECIIFSYMQNPNYDLGMKEMYDNIISQITLDVPSTAPAETTQQATTEVPQQTIGEVPSAPELQHYEVNLGAGYYTIGKDIPAGTYYISTVSGSGNVHSSGGINEIFGGDYGIPEFNNYKAETGKILEVSGDVIIFLSSDNANLVGMTPRTTLENYNWWEMPAGNYTVGIDIPAGPYYVTAVEGSGNAHISDHGHNDGDLNEIFAVVPEYSGYITSFNNLYLYEGNVIEITSSLRLHFDQIGE